jgi:hypothetical protein
MTTDVEESQPDTHAQFFKEMDSAADALHKFAPDLVVVFGPDHFNGFFYELMPSFCIGTAAEGTKDWHLESVRFACRANLRFRACGFCSRETSTSRSRIR